MGEIQIASTPRLAKIVEPPLDPLQVADAVAVRVLKGARVDLIDHARLPPERGHGNSLGHDAAVTISLVAGHEVIASEPLGSGEIQGHS